MTEEQRWLWGFTGMILGGLVAWVLGLAYVSMFDGARGDLVIPFALVLVGALAFAGRPHLRPFSIGLIVGAGIETAFFFLLFSQLSG